MPFEGGETPELILDREGDIQQPRFTTGGRWVVFCERAVSGQTDIVAHSFGVDSAMVTLVATPAFGCGPDVSPDGRWLAFESSETGAVDVYVRPLDASANARWQITQDESWEHAAATTAQTRRSPRWSSDGRELFYLNGKREMVVVPVATCPTFTFGQPRVLSALDARTDWSGEVLPGGQGLVLIRRHRDAPGQVMMIRNFDRVLRGNWVADVTLAAKTKEMRGCPLVCPFTPTSA